MNNSGTENEDVDFSIICPQAQDKNRLDFSIQSLLDHPPSETSHIKPENSLANNSLIYQQGSFMKGLEKMEKSISYESTPYDIYEVSDEEQLTHTIEVKQESTETRTMNNTKGTSRVFERQADPEVVHLIIDFEEGHEDLKFKQKTNFQSYFGLGLDKESERLSFPPSFQKNISIIKLSPMNLKVKTKLKKKKVGNSKTKTSRSVHKEVVSNLSVKKRDRDLFKTERSSQHLSGSRQKSKFKREKKKTNMDNKETRKQNIDEQYYGYNNEKGTIKKHKLKKQVSGEKSKKIIISKKNIKTIY